MLGTLDPQRNFFDELLFKDMLPAEHPLLDIDRAVDFSFAEAETADLCSSETGRPSYPPEQLFRVLFLEVWANLSDVQVCLQLRYNVLYRCYPETGARRALLPGLAAPSLSALALPGRATLLRRAPVFIPRGGR